MKNGSEAAPLLDPKFFGGGRGFLESHYDVLWPWLTTGTAFPNDTPLLDEYGRKNPTLSRKV